MAASAAADGTRIKSRSDFLSSGSRDGAAVEEDEDVENEAVENGEEKGAEAVRRASAGRCGWHESAAPRRSKHAAMRRVRGLRSDFFFKIFSFKFYRFLRASLFEL